LRAAVLLFVVNRSVCAARCLTAVREIGNFIALARNGEDFERQGRSVAMDLLCTFVRSGATGARPRSTLPASGPS
jgi:hypothetical protein